MFRRDIFALVSVAIIGLVLTIYLTMGATPFFPASLRTTMGECPSRSFRPAYERVVLDQFEMDWFASDLQAFHEEPLLPQQHASSRTVRFSYRPGFYSPVMVRTTESEDGQVHLLAKRMAGWNGCRPHTPSCVVDRTLTSDETRRLKTAQEGLLQRPSHGCSTGVDGSRWIIEASGHGEYRLWHEWTPEAGDIRELGTTMLALTGWEFERLL